MSVRAEKRLSQCYRDAASLLSDQWTGTYSDLAAKVGTVPRAIGRIVKGYSLRHPTWNTANVYKKGTTCVTP